jgi:predicted anti-sigma-YlaC factor YlaD
MYNAETDIFSPQIQKSAGGDLTLTGHVKIELRDEFGNIKESREHANLVVTAGKSFLAQLLQGAAVTNMSHVAIGTSSQAAAAGDTALIGTELARVATTKTVSTNNTIMTTTFGPGVGTGTINEAAILNAASAGTMLARFVFGGAVTKAAADSLTVTWTITFN